MKVLQGHPSLPYKYYPSQTSCSLQDHIKLTRQGLYSLLCECEMLTILSNGVKKK